MPTSPPPSPTGRAGVGVPTDFGGLNRERRRYRATTACAQSKPANLLVTSELRRRPREVSEERTGAGK